VWSHIFDLPLSVSEKVLRAALIYGFLIIALRLAGRRAQRGTSTVDLLVMVLLANAVQNGIIGSDNSVTGACLGAAVVLTLDRGLDEASSRFPPLNRWLNGAPATRRSPRS
jgi:uncharacterized membrane protein YcaP (DUF421 family)